MKTFTLKSNPRVKKRRALKQQRGRARRKKTIRVRRNPPRSRNFGFIVEALVRTRKRRFKTYWWDGRTFTRDRDKGYRYPNEFMAKGFAQRILPQMNAEKVYALRVVKA